MTERYIGIPVSTERFVKLCETIKMRGLQIDPVDAVQSAIDQWIVGNSTKQAESLAYPSEGDKDGFWWKNVFVPAGSRVRMNYRSRRFEAVANSHGISFEGATLSPSEFVWTVTRTNRNAWRDIEFAFPGSNEWISADKLRREEI